MNDHPETLNQTCLWKRYESVCQNKTRMEWIKTVYRQAVTQLKTVRDTFPNYTLHDDKHVLNVLYAIGGLLGNQIESLTVGELELLILAAALHDIGMVYTDEEKKSEFALTTPLNVFIRTKRPELYGVAPKDWSEKDQQWFLRDRHPFRIDRKLSKQQVWQEIINSRPVEIVPMNTIVAVCRSHGEDAKAIKNRDELKYDSYYNVNPLFCAVLLRLADLLDFDDTRAPRVLFEYAASDAKSVEEWQKHMNSRGFKYPNDPSDEELPYAAECDHPNLEHAIHEFLNYIDEELFNARSLLHLCNEDWQRNFPLPREISRKNITRVGYVSDEFNLTMDQEQILKLLSGENLYENNAVFIRELLQNAVDATLLRGRMERDFDVDSARIDLWEWTDRDGNMMFRIDDRGTGMTLGILKRYFLKVANSYYTSKEIKRDLQDHGFHEDYHSISRFGIGFLSCFLCGIDVEVSTLYFDDNKSADDLGVRPENVSGFGLRINVTGLRGYYVLKSQAENHIPSVSLPASPNMQESLEINGYRSTPGTSIVIRLDPGRLGIINLKEEAEKVICGTRMPIYYNNERVGRTYNEIMIEAHKYVRKPEFYDLTDHEKLEFDKRFPYLKGNYPRISLTITPLDFEARDILPSFSGILVSYDSCSEKPLQWEARGESFRLSLHVHNYNNVVRFTIFPDNVHHDLGHPARWYEYEDKYGYDAMSDLWKSLSCFDHCPDSPDALGDVWRPFESHEVLRHMWDAFVSNEQHKFIEICASSARQIHTMESLTGCQGINANIIVYQGIVCFRTDMSFGKYALFFLNDELQPTMDISRTRIVDLPLKVCTAIAEFLYHYYEKHIHISFSEKMIYEKSINTMIRVWRTIFNEPLGKWILNSQHSNIEKIKEYLQLSQGSIEAKKGNRFDISIDNDITQLLADYICFYLQETYVLSVDYVKGGLIIFEERNEVIDPRLDWFPPMLFCKAANSESEKILCFKETTYRKCVTLNHPFMRWMLDNAELLYNQYSRQFQQIILSLRNDEAVEIMKTVNDFRKMLDDLQSRGCFNPRLFEPLTDTDFWEPMYDSAGY